MNKASQPTRTMATKAMPMKYQYHGVPRRSGGVGGEGDCSEGSGAGGSLAIPSPSARERFRQFRLGNDYHALLGHLKAALLVVVEVVTDGGVGWDVHVLVDDRLADAAMAANVNALEEDGIVHQRIAVDADIR